MLKNYEVNSLAEFYKIIKDDMLNANIQKPRGTITKEIVAPQILLKNPTNIYAHNPDRKFSGRYAFVEALMLLVPNNGLKYLSKYNENIAKFSDDGETVTGSYGYRIAKNIPKLIKLLKEDPDSRQAILPILGKEDIYKQTKDVPCTNNLQFLIRDNKLNLAVNMRSNDIMWGLPYDMFMFSILQQIIANSLEIKVGWYLHRPISLHLYEHHFELFENVADKFKNIQIAMHDTYEWTKKFAEFYIEEVDIGRKKSTVVEMLYKTYILDNL